MKHCGTQQLETDRLMLRRYVRKDAAAMYKNWASDDEVTKYLTWPTHTSQEISQGVIEDWVNQYSKEDYYHWAVILKENGDEPIGDIAVVSKNEKIAMAHIGYCIGRKWWHKGITAEALKAVMDFLFDRVDVRRIEARHDPRNPNSGEVMKKCGMKYEGTLHSSDWNNQGICDACCYRLLKSERDGEVFGTSGTDRRHFIKLGEVGLLTNDVIKLANFYKMLLEVDNGSDDMVHQTIISEETMLTVYNDGTEKNNQNRNICLAFTVENMDKAYRKVLDLGAEVIEPPTVRPWGATNMRFYDPDGNIIYLRSFSK